MDVVEALCEHVWVKIKGRFVCVECGKEYDGDDSGKEYDGDDNC